MSSRRAARLSHVGVVGCGLMGQRRAAILRSDRGIEAITACDVDGTAAGRVALRSRSTDRWEDVVGDPAVDAVIVATPNAIKEEITRAALANGKHVLLEKPMGASLADAERIARCAAAHPNVLKVGFNHRHYPGLVRARELARTGQLGEPVFARVSYGHGAHRDFGRDWRCAGGEPGGGQLLDQGSHVLDLLNWLFGRPVGVKAEIRTGFYSRVDDNVFGLLSYDGPLVAQFHVSWTQWKNRFAFDLAFTEGSLEVTGLARSYGAHRVTEYRRTGTGPPDQVDHVHDTDETLRAEWREFRDAIERGTPFGGTAEDGLAVMETADRIRWAAAVPAGR